MTFQQTAFIGLSAFALAACDSGSSPAATPVNTNLQTNTATKSKVSIDATDVNNYVYYQLDDLLANKLTVADDKTDVSWDIAFKASEVKINGGAAGSGSIEAALAVPRDSYYNADGSANLTVFKDGRDPVAESLMTLAEVTSATDFSALTFSSATESTAINGDWYTGGRSGVTIHDDQYWLVRSASADSYFKLRIKEATFSPQGYISTMKLGASLQAKTSSSFAAEAEHNITFDGTAGDTKCVDLDTFATVNCSTPTGWDISISPNSRASIAYAIRLNGGATLGGAMSKTDVDAIADGSTLSHGWAGDTVKDIFSDKPWYAYTGAPDHKILPNFRVYVIKDGGSYYKLQVQSYYNSSSESRHLTVNVEKL